MFWTADRHGEKERHALTATTYPVRAMLRTYGRQVTTARRLARYHRLQRLEEPAEADEAARLREVKRADLVRRVAVEIVENCIVTGSDSPVVDEIKAALEAELGFPLTFAYPPEEREMLLYRSDKTGQPVEITGADKAAVLHRLWELALEKVDETML
jgi:hypothetical protein